MQRIHVFVKPWRMRKTASLPSDQHRHPVDDMRPPFTPKNDLNRRRFLPLSAGVVGAGTVLSAPTARSQWAPARWSLSCTREVIRKRYHSLSSEQMKALCFGWDYTEIDPDKQKADPNYRWGKPVPLDLMEHRCGLCLKWLKEGRVSDLVILGLAGIDQGIPSAPWMRDWIKQHEDEKLNR